MVQEPSERPDTDRSTSETERPGDAASPRNALANEGGRRVVVVLGSGRSGTSLCAKILGELGVRMEATLHRPNEMNPEGYFEDLEIVKINRRMLEKLSPVPSLPPRSDVRRSALLPELTILRDYLSERISATPGIWGFKDPRVSLVLPYYRRIFDELGIVPVYVFCARDAASTVQSLMAVGSVSREMAEMLYFTRNFLALRDCGANCHVLHYERLLADPVGQIESLWGYISGPNAELPLSPQVAKGLVNPALNRSTLRSEPIRSRLAARIEALIKGMEGTAFDRNYVVNELREIDEIHTGYQVWLDRFGDKLEETQKSVGRSAGKDGDPKATREIERLRKDFERQRAIDYQRLSELQEELGRKVQQIASLEREIADIADLQQQADDAIRSEAALRSSVDGIMLELSRHRAESSRLAGERDAAVTRARSQLGELAEQKKALEKSATDMARRQAEVDKAIAAARKGADIARREAADAKNQLERQGAENARIVASIRYRAGRLLVDAITTPGLHTLALPWRLLRLRASSASQSGVASNAIDHREEGAA